MTAETWKIEKIQTCFLLLRAFAFVASIEYIPEIRIFSGCII